MKNLLLIQGEELNAAPAASDTTSVEATPAHTLEQITDPETLKESVDKLLDYDLSSLVNTLAEGAVNIGLKILAALVIFYIGRWIVRRMMLFMDRVYERRKVEVSLRSFLSGIIKVLLYVAIILVVIQVLGINTTSIVAMLASAGLAIGMALSGTLQNFAGGVMILFLKPYRVGDYIDAQGEEGTVSKIGLFSTEIRTVDNRVIYIPNSTISTSVIDNYSMSEMRRVDWSVAVDYGTDANKVREALMAIMRSDKRIVGDPEPVVFLTEMGDSAVKFSARGWVRNSDYWDVKFNINERIYTELTEAGFSFARPKMDVRVKNN